MPQLPRRQFLALSATGLAALPWTAQAAQPDSARRPLPKKGDFPVRVVSSANGLEATRKAYQMISEGSDPLDAVIAGVAIVEDDPKDTSVGYGGLPNEAGIVELDAAVMHGPTHSAGAVASLRYIKNPAQVTQRVMQQSDHVLLVGEGALQFARAHGFKEQNLLTERARKIWLHWKQHLSENDDWLPPPKADLDPEVSEFFRQHSLPSYARRTADGRPNPMRFVRPTGTIHCSALNANGDMSCVTTTSGLAFKIPGRVGDSPIIGAGLYVDNAIGSCGSTGRGEANLQNLCSFAAVELMRGGMSPADAGLEICRRVAGHTYRKDLLNADGQPNFGLKFYLLDKTGRHAGVTLWGPSQYAVTDAEGTRLEDCAYLLKQPE